MPASLGAGIFLGEKGCAPRWEVLGLNLFGTVFLGEKRAAKHKKTAGLWKVLRFGDSKIYLYLEITSSFNSKNVPFFMASRARSIKRIKKRMLCMEIKRWLVSSAERNKWLI